LSISSWVTLGGHDLFGIFSTGTELSQRQIGRLESGVLVMMLLDTRQDVPPAREKSTRDLEEGRRIGHTFEPRCRCSATQGNASLRGSRYV
jgi:hypothetical protein